MGYGLRKHEMINGMNHVTLAVTDVERSFNFYKNTLGLKPLCKWDKGAYFLVGIEESPAFWFCLNYDDKRVTNPCYTHYAFSVSPAEFEAMSQKIISSGAVVFKENTSPGESLYFLDPDGHKLEIHVGNWQTRIDIKKQNPDLWRDVEWYI
jgi:catechol 2,3-dioxygenase-like lactoylglutathione lyase family enzyme